LTLIREKSGGYFLSTENSREIPTFSKNRKATIKGLNQLLLSLIKIILKAALSMQVINGTLLV